MNGVSKEGSGSAAEEATNFRIHGAARGQPRRLVKGKETKPVLVSIGNPTVGLPYRKVKRWAKSRKTHGFIAFLILHDR